MTDRADLDTGAVIAHRIFHPAFDGVLVAGFFHIDKIDNDQSR